MRTIDIHTHLLAPSALRAMHDGVPWHGATIEIGERGWVSMVRNGKRRHFARPDHMMSIPERIAAMDRMGVDTQVLSLIPPLQSGYEVELEQAVGLTRETNDEIAALIAQHPGRFLGLASIPAQSVDAAIAELERTMHIPGFVGIELLSHVKGVDWDSPLLFPILEAAQSLGALVFMHPQHPRSPALGQYNLVNLIGNPLETTIAVASLVFGGVLDRLPDIRFCMAHGGGYVPFAIGRFDHGYRVRPEANATAKQIPSDYLRRFYFDTVLFNDHLVRLLVDLMGADRVVLGSDFPADMGPEDPVGDVSGNPLLSEDERTAILGGNLARMFDLEADAG